jgi:hypothetical protein
MIAAAGTFQLMDGKVADYFLNADPSLPLE